MIQSGIYLSYKKIEVLLIKNNFEISSAIFKKSYLGHFSKLWSKKILCLSKIVVYSHKKIQNCTTYFAIQCHIDRFPANYQNKLEPLWWWGGDISSGWSESVYSVHCPWSPVTCSPRIKKTNRSFSSTQIAESQNFWIHLHISKQENFLRVKMSC